MNVLKSVLVFVSFLVTVDARTLLSQNKPFRQILHDYQHVQYFADFKIGEQDIAGIFDGNIVHTPLRRQIDQGHVSAKSCHVLADS